MIDVYGNAYNQISSVSSVLQCQYECQKVSKTKLELIAITK